MRLNQAIAVTCLLCVSAVAAADDDVLGCKFNAERAGGLDLTGVTKVLLRTGPGDLEVRGSPAAVRLEARGRACASTPELLERITLTVRREGDVAIVEAAVREEEKEIWVGTKYAYLNLGVALPASLPVEALDSSGDLKMTGLRSLKLQDSSGDIEIRNVAELVDVRDSSGEIDIRDVHAVRIEDSSGDIEIESIKADVEVLSDSSGDIVIDNVDGKVAVRQDSSGEIKIVDVRGDVAIDVDSSGGIEVARVDGDFLLGVDSSGGVQVDEVKGRVTLP